MSVEGDEESLPAGTLFGRYRIERKIGAGAMGAVYAATHVGLNKPVVVKVLLPQHAQSRAIRQRFLREGEAAARIRHPHVVDVTDVGMHEQMPYLVMERLEGESLGALIDRDGALAPDLAVELMLPVLAAVDAAHAAGVVHRDLKPENLFVARTPNGGPHPKVLDFGISRVVSDEAARQTGTAAMLGTPAYMAPEQITSSRDVDARSDQYSLGVILYECLTGRRAFNGNNIYAILRQVGEGSFLPPRASRPELPAALEAAVLRAMALDPASRFPSLREFAAALMPFGSERARVLWGAPLRPSAAEFNATLLRDRASVAPALAQKQAPAAALAPVRPSDTLVAAAGVRDTADEAGPRRNRATWTVAAVGALLACVVVVVVARTRTSTGAGAPRQATASGPSAPEAPATPAVGDAAVPAIEPTRSMTPPAAPSTSPSSPAAPANLARGSGRHRRPLRSPSHARPRGIDIPP